MNATISLEQWNAMTTEERTVALKVGILVRPEDAAKLEQQAFPKS